MSDSSTKLYLDIPILPLRDVVIYPHMVIPLFVGREKSVQALDIAMSKDKKVLLVAQKNAEVEGPTEHEIYSVGTVSTILQLLKLPDGTIKVLVEGDSRAKVDNVKEVEGSLHATAQELDDGAIENYNEEIEALVRSVNNLFSQYIKGNKKIPPEVITSLAGIDEPSRLADTIAAHLPLKLEEKQKILEIVDTKERLSHLLDLMESELDIILVEKRIRRRVKQQMEKSQREYYLNEQMKAIQKELGDISDSNNELEKLEKNIIGAGMPSEALDKAQSELSKLKMMSPMSAESAVIRNYLETLISVPWKKRSKIRSSLAEAEKILEKDHFGLDKVKERILEYLAVQKRSRKLKGPILCLVGPPGVGKTSLGRSIARATGRKFCRISLGGVKDEAEIRGHRRTYVGSMPGKVAQKLIKVGTKNPLMLLDEIDKISMDFRGDPSSALLEVLDSEQNNTFGDHFLEVDIDLSDITFVATANSMNIPKPLLDRMEVIRIPGYTEQEKEQICNRYLIPENIKNSGLKDNEIEFLPESVQSMVRSYTREAGVRGLDRTVSKVCRKVVKELLLDEVLGKIIIAAENLEKYLGVPSYRYGLAEENDLVGQVTGLAWTDAGGELLSIESVVVPGSGKLSYTGQLGDVMQESIQAAMMVVRSRALNLDLSDNFYKECDVHIHVPEGAIPKDGPSAGVGMCVALVSALTNAPVSSNLAMTGEITLRGKVLPIGGLKEKVLAALRGGIKKILIPKENKKNLIDIPTEILEKIEIVPIEWIDEALEIALIKDELVTKPKKNLSNKKDKLEKETISDHHFHSRH